MSKTQYQYHSHPLKFTYSLYLATQIYTAESTRQNITLPDNLHYAACKQSDSRVDPNARSSERSERAPIDRSRCYECARYCSEWVNERISDPECSDVSHKL